MKEFLVFVLLSSAPLADKQAIAQKWRSVFRSDTTVQLSDCTPIRKVSNHSVTAYMLVVRTSWIKRKARPVFLDNVTPAKFDTWKTANLTDPNKFQIRTTDSWKQAMQDAGWEVIPIPFR